MRNNNVTECLVEDSVINALFSNFTEYAAGFANPGDYTFLDHEWFKHGTCKPAACARMHTRTLTHPHLHLTRLIAWHAARVRSAPMVLRPRPGNEACYKQSDPVDTWASCFELPAGMPGSLADDKLAYFTLALQWAQRVRNSEYSESAAALYVEAKRGQAFPPANLTSILGRKGVPRCNSACQLTEVRDCNVMNGS